ncbi:ribonuclease P protein component [bacterium endosymbiont of Pedicinus badii]|uniref:ribonuclease P protein component n=1 Tax=bacterium endosymbiont of Pedicinus badii TaxID=1719126 RepID=UPI0009D41E96|nr:ribonuclease P protein component [bacterium endosymbiont of Pedicinus badii]OQM34070.1 hypothetical protein AOQ89_01800 [bacterium endosymbiont of Pedicinus badii]
MKNFGFSKKFKLLKHQTHFSSFYYRKYFFCKEIKIFFKINYLAHPRLGINIPKKNVSYSFQRNKIKRIIRETFRKNKVFLKNMDFLIFYNKKIKKVKDCSILQKKMVKLWKNFYYI